jgi:hypothetical protein
MLTNPSDGVETAYPAATKISDTYNQSRDCTLFSLPRELRDQIYDNLIESGRISIFRTSKILHWEAKERLPTHGVCRINVDPSRPTLEFYLPEDSVHIVDKVRLRILLIGQMSIRGLYRDLQPIRRLARSNKIVRKSCHIIVEDHLDGAPDCCSETRHQPTRGAQMISSWHYHYLETLIHFNIVTLEIRQNGHDSAIRPSKNADIGSLLQSSPPHNEVRLSHMYQSTLDQLQPCLGPGEWQPRTDSLHSSLTFHPQEYADTRSLEASSRVEFRLDNWAAPTEADEDSLERR